MSLIKRLFEPPKEIVNYISDKGKYKIFSETFDRRKIKENNSGQVRNIIDFYSKKMASFYGFKKHELNSRLDSNMTYDIIGEMWLNSFYYGPQDEKIHIGLILGNEGLCYAVNDSGDFFKSEETKKNVEGRIRFDEDGSGFNNIIYPRVNLIEVDTKKGTLFCALEKDKVIKRR